MCKEETYGQEALAEFVTLLEDRARRSGGSFLIGSEYIKKMFRDRYGLSSQGAARMHKHIEQIMLDNDVFEVWDSWIKGSNGTRSIMIYRVNVFALVTKVIK